MQARQDAISIHSPLPFENCLSVIREALAESDLEVANELAVHRQVRTKLGLQLRKYTIFTVWDPVQVYQALRSDGVPSIHATFDIVVLELGARSIVVAPTESSLGADAGSTAARFMGHSLWEKAERVLSQVEATRETAENDSGSLHFAHWLRREAQNVLRLVTGGAR
jgi:uncharacterized protein (DUF302 family)